MKRGQRDVIIRKLNYAYSELTPGDLDVASAKANITAARQLILRIALEDDARPPSRRKKR